MARFEDIETPVRILRLTQNSAKLPASQQEKRVTGIDTFVSLLRFFYLFRAGSEELTMQPGMPGPHVGIGKVAEGDWWLGRIGAFFGVTAAAATPATTTDKAKMRMASFITGNLFL
jgi:hypothetical protein